MGDVEEDSSMEMEEVQQEKSIRQPPKVNRGIDRKKTGLYQQVLKEEIIVQ